MGKTQKKNSKGRLDRYYYLAKEKGYRARSSFKIIQINEKFGHFLEKSKVVIDLCAAPGSWCQVASKLCPVNSLIIGVDIVPMKSMPNVITFQSDITTEDCRSKLRGYMKTWKADTVLHDGAPNVGLGWAQDAFTQSQLTLQALKLAVENLVVNGTFITKIFRSKDYNKLLWVFQQLFDKVEATKPPASRNVSAEIFVVCKGFKAPKKLDPRLLDPKEVFEELPDGPQNMESKIYNPEKKVRKRQGYEEGDNLLYHEASIMDFIKTEDPITMLGEMNKFIIDKEDHEWKIIKKLKHTDKELLSCLDDLKVLGKKDFKMILRWRKNARELLGIDKEEEKVVEVTPLTEEEQIEKELKDLQEKRRLDKRREKRKKNESKQKEITRMQMNMLTPNDIGIEAADVGKESLFDLKTAEKTGILDKLAKGKKRMIFTDEQLAEDNDIHIDSNELGQLRDEDQELNDLEDQLDSMYDSYKARRAERDAHFRAKQARGGDHDDEWTGFTDSGKNNEDEEEEDEKKDYIDDDDSDMSDSDDDDAINSLISKLKGQTGDSKLSSKARMLFNDPIFEDVSADLPTNKQEVSSESVGNVPKTVFKRKLEEEKREDGEDDDSSDDSSDESDFEIVANEESTHDDFDSDYDSEEERKQTSQEKHAKELDIATVEAMTLAHQLALGHKTKNDLVNEGFNRYSFRDTENLPDWFIEDEKQHSKINRPITKEAAMALKEKMKALNARPIKKVAEAKARKKMRAVARIEKIKRKAGLINDDGDKSERDKAEEISKLMRKVNKKQRTTQKVTLVYATGKNAGLSGRPKGVKGRYKMVDGSLKNEQRALKRIAKKHHKKKKN